MAEQPIGPILDGLGIVVDLDPGEFVENAVVLTKISGDNGQALLGIYGPDSLSWLDKLGLIEAAKHRVTSTAWGDQLPQPADRHRRAQGRQAWAALLVRLPARPAVTDTQEGRHDASS